MVINRRERKELLILKVGDVKLQKENHMKYLKVSVDQSLSLNQLAGEIFLVRVK